MISGIGASGLSQSMSVQWNRASQKDPAQMAKELFASTDADGSGAIDQEELSAALAAKSTDGRGPDAAELFSALDADGDGRVTEAEHESGLASMHKDLAQASMLTNMSRTRACRRWPTPCSRRPMPMEMEASRKRNWRPRWPPGTGRAGGVSTPRNFSPLWTPTATG